MPVVALVPYLSASCLRKHTLTLLHDCVASSLQAEKVWKELHDPAQGLHNESYYTEQTDTLTNELVACPSVALTATV